MREERAMVITKIAQLIRRAAFDGDGGLQRGGVKQTMYQTEQVIGLARRGLTAFQPKWDEVKDREASAMQ